MRDPLVAKGHDERSELRGLVPEYGQDAIAIWGDWLATADPAFEDHETWDDVWRNRTTGENAAWLLGQLRAKVERLTAELSPFRPMTPEEAERELATVAGAEPLTDDRIKSIVRYATGSDLDRAEITADNYRRAYRAADVLREKAQAEAAQLRERAEIAEREVAALIERWPYLSQGNPPNPPPVLFDAGVGAYMIGATIYPSKAEAVRAAAAQGEGEGGGA